jgi:zona occludens toxin
MIYLTTGANGAGKTLVTLRDVRAQQVKETRPVYFHGFEAGQQLLDWGWQEFDPKKWQDLPDGSICVMDECQNEFPMRGSSAAVPDYVNAIAQFRRKRGFDFWMIAPHPSMIDLFVRRLIDKPSWHRHLKRAFGADVVSVLKFGAPNMQCEKPGAGASAEVSMVGFPKEVYDWYKSASLHTGKKQIPKQVYMMGIAVVLIPLLIYGAYSKLMNKAIPEKPPVAAGAVAPAGIPGASVVRPQANDKKSLSPVEYAQSFVPRIEGFPQSAPRYDDVTQVVQAPKTAACIYGTKPGAKVKTCGCWSQQATPLMVPEDTCKAIAAGGFFDDTVRPEVMAKAPPAAAAAPVGGAATVPPVAPPVVVAGLKSVL